MKKGLYISVLLLAAIASSCSREKSGVPEDAVLEVAGSFLYKSDIDNAVPVELEGEDSVRLAKMFIRHWVTDKLLYDNARKNLQNTYEIDQMVEEYRKSLMIYAYEQQMMNQKMNKEVSEEEMQSLYNELSAELPTDEQGRPMKYEEAREKMQELLLTRKKSDFLEDFEDNMYDKAIKDGDVTFFNKEKNQK